ncbi:MAG: YcaO-like family protein, partial [Lentisphaerae bacterium]|nr:YcaO-like family protein [Lentisphaerota bacterium]
SAEDQERVLKHDFRAMRSQPDDCDNFMSSFMFGFLPLANAEFLREGEVIPYTKREGYGDCLEDLARGGEILKSLGLDCYVVDWTDPEIGFPVVQAIVPGYSDVLPFHPSSSNVLFSEWTRKDVLDSYRT